MCGGGGGGGIGNFIAPILGIVASIAMPYLAPALLPLEAGLIGAGIGAGTNLLGDAITGRPVDPLGLAVSTVTGGAGGYLGAGGFSDIAGALGLGESATAPAASMMAGTSPDLGIAGGAAVTPYAGPVGSIGGVTPGATAAGASLTPEAMGAGVNPDLGIGGPSATTPYPGPVQAPTSNIFSMLGKGYEAVKPALSVASAANTITGLGKAVFGGGEQQSMTAAPSMAAPSMGSGYTTGQGGRYGGGLGTVWRPDLGAYATSYAPGQQPKGGGFSDTANTLLGQDSTMMG